MGIAALLGVTLASAPDVRPLEESEPRREAVAEACCADYALNPGAFDFKGWVRDVLTPWASALCFVRRLRTVLRTRQGGWAKLAEDLETCPEAYTDVVRALQRPAKHRETLKAWLGVERPS